MSKQARKIGGGYSDSAESTEVVSGKGGKSGKKKIAVISVLSVLIIGIILVVLKIFINKNPEEDSTADLPASVVNETGDGAEAYDGDPNTLFTDLEETPLYQLDGLAEIDISKSSHTPGDKDSSLTWIDNARSSFAHGSYSDYRPQWAQLSEKSTGRIMDFYFYTNPSTGEIVKVINNDYQDNGTVRTVFYYRDGKPELICRSMLSNSSDTITAKDGAGERYYFINDFNEYYFNI